MAGIIRNVTKCGLCGDALKDGELIYEFPPFVQNELDPFLTFSDHGYHEMCLRLTSRGKAAIARANEWRDKAALGNSKCAVCGAEILDEGNHLFIGHLTAEADNPLREFNYTHLHKTCIPAWDKKARFIVQAKMLMLGEKWKGDYLPRLIRQIEGKE